VNLVCLERLEGKDPRVLEECLEARGLTAPEVPEARTDRLECRECQEWKVARGPQEQMGLRDPMDPLDRQDLLETVVYLVFLVLLVLLVPRGNRAPRGKGETLGSQEKKDHLDPLECRGLQGPLERGVKGGRRDPQANRVLPAWEAGLEIRVLLVLPV